MGDLIELDLCRPMEERIKIMKRFNKNGSSLEQLAIPEELELNGEYPFQFSKSDSAMEKLIKLAKNTAARMRKDD